MKETIHQWADKFLKSPVQEMSKQTATMFVQISIGIPKDAPLNDVIARSEGDFGVGVLAGRVKAIDLDITGQAFALIRVICDSPGNLVMWALALRSWQLRHGNRQVTMDTISMDLFPRGFPTERALSEAWDAQKTDEGFNLLDQATAAGVLKNEEKADAAAG